MVVAAVIAALAGYGYASYTVVVAPEIAGFVLAPSSSSGWPSGAGHADRSGTRHGRHRLHQRYLSGNLPYVWKLIVGIIFVVVIVALPEGFLR